MNMPTEVFGDVITTIAWGNMTGWSFNGGLWCHSVPSTSCRGYLARKVKAEAFDAHRRRNAHSTEIPSGAASADLDGDAHVVW